MNANKKTFTDNVTFKNLIWNNLQTKVIQHILMQLVLWKSMKHVFEFWCSKSLFHLHGFVFSSLIFSFTQYKD